MGKLKYIFWVAFVVCVILTTHIAYQYITLTSPKKPGKWWTFVEATFQDISYIPYLGWNKKDDYYQSFFFDTCIKTQLSWSKIDYNDNLCKVNTLDFKVFTVQLAQDKQRSDQTPLTLDDVERTYSTLLINNVRNISKFDTYKSIDIRKKWSSLILTFPTASYDNFAFFTNFILPKHILSNQDLSYYTNTFVKNPVVSQCARIQPSTSDEKSLLINTQECPNVYFNYYQIKKFASPEDLQWYVWQGNTNTVDLYIDPIAISWYTSHRLLSSIYPTIFFNVKSDRLSISQRTYLAHLWHHTLFADRVVWSTSWSSSTGVDISSWDQHVLHPIIQNDRFLFDYFPPLSGVVFNPTSTIAPSPKALTTNLPASIYIKGNNKKFFYQLWEIKDRVELSMRFDVPYQKVWISANNGPEYVPESYQATGKKLQYNIAPKYGNIKPWYNSYIVRWYGSGNIPFKIATITITYKPKTDIPVQMTPTNVPKLRFVYQDTTINQAIVNRIDYIMRANKLDSYIQYVATWQDQLESIIQSRSYDIVLQNLDLGFKKDISWLFSIDNPKTNPSLYQNSELSSFISQYFIANKKIKAIVKQGIDDLYTKDVPIMIIGKLYQFLWTKNTIQIQASDRLYDATARRDFISNIYFADAFDLQWSRILDMRNIWNFIINSLRGV
jgi:hypothetical protein